MFVSLFPILISLLSTLLALGMATFVLSRTWRAWVNRWLALGLSSVALQQALMLASSLAEPAPWRLALFRFALAIMATIPPCWLAFSLIFAESSGRSRLTCWRPALLGLTGTLSLAWIGLAAGRIVHPIRLAESGIILIGLDAWGKVFFSLYVVALVLILLNFENVYRFASRPIRWKIKHLVVGAFVAFSGQIVAVSYALLYGFIHPLSPLFGALAFLLGEAMIAFALVRHRLLDVDIFVSRYVVYRSVTLALVGGYLLSLGLIAEVFQRLGIPLDLMTGTFLAIFGGLVLSLLLLSDDVRRRVKAFIHTHFYKHKYDYRVEWMEYTRRLSRAAAAPDIAAQTINRILEVMWVRQAAMYVIGDSPEEMTLAHQVEYANLPPSLRLADTMRDALLKHARAVPSGMGPENSSSTDDFRALGQSMFSGVAVECAVPVAALDALVGLLVVGPELSGKPFGVDDRDLLVAVAAQAGALILNARLSQEASEGRELQALARLSAFVAHDLKNTISMLAMLAENAKVHLSKPEFQADAIRTLGDATTRMQKLLRSLAAPGRVNGDEAQPISLAPTIESWIREMSDRIPSRIRIETRLGRTSDVRICSEQFRSVFQNLLLNGVEAIPEQGTILLETYQEDGHAVLAVTDTGQGMTQEFIRQKLFRPFQSTKARGLGIGLYQCRHVIQSLGGTLTAESERGKGTRMTIKFPAIAGSPPAASVNPLP